MTEPQNRPTGEIGEIEMSKIKSQGDAEKIVACIKNSQLYHYACCWTNEMSEREAITEVYELAQAIIALHKAKGRCRFLGDAVSKECEFISGDQGMVICNYYENQKECEDYVEEQ